MSMVSYAEHRSSEIGPHGHLPLHWKPGLVKRFYVVSLGKMVTSSEVVETRGTRPYLRSANIQDGRLDISDIKTMWFSEAEQSALNLKKGDLLVCEGGDAGRCAILDRDLEEFGFQNSVNRVRSVGGCGGSAKYLNYWLKFLKQAGWIEVICNRSTIAHLTAGKLGSIELPHPPPDEQRAIATFLDRETGRIDELIAEQERLVGLLDEKRQSVISHAVTKGLDSSVAMKDSGCAWIGSMPIQWAVSRIGYYAAVKNGCTPDRDNPSYWIDGQIAWVSSGEVNQYVVLDASEYITQAALDESNLRIIPSGAVLVGLIGQGKTRGMAALLGIPTTINQNVAAVIPWSLLSSSFLHYSLQAAYEFLRECGRGGNQAALNCEILSSFRIAIPSVEEQVRICHYLDAAVTAMAAIVDECKAASRLLRERRAALISAAVTGKIDVRSLVADAPAMQEAAE